MLQCMRQCVSEDYGFYGLKTPTKLKPIKVFIEIQIVELCILFSFSCCNAS